MKRNFSVRLSLVVVATLLVLYLTTSLLLNPLPSYGQRTVQYIVVDPTTQSALWDRHLNSWQNLQKLLNHYGNQGWHFIPSKRTDVLIFKRF